MVNLHQHSNFSDGYGFPEQIAEYSKELNYTGIALTDHGTVSGFYYLQKVAIEFGLKPIYGVEVYLIPTPEARKMKNSTFHTILLAKNLEGLKELYRIISISNDEEHFYRKPKIDLKSLYNNSSNLVVLSGCFKNPVAQAYLNGYPEEAERLLSFFNDHFDYYYEVQPYNKEEIIKSTNFVLKHKNIRTVATLDAHYIRPEDQIIEQFNIAVKANKTWKNIDKLLPLYLRSESDLYNEIENIYGKDVAKQSIQGINEIENKISNFKLPSKEQEITTPEDIAKFKSLIKENIFKIKLNSEYKERLRKEYNLIKKKNYIPYFLKVYDLIQKAKKVGAILDYGRGSAVGSLICYLLGITKVDPVKHKLIFERFISETRKDPPDIDLDFDPEGKDRLLKEISKDKEILQMRTLNLYKIGNLMDDIRRVFELDPLVVDKIKSIEADSFDQIDNKLLKNIPYIENLKNLLGQIRYLGRHASGYLIEKDLHSYTPKIFENTSSFDPFSAREMNLLKFDLLGLKTLSTLKYFDDINIKDYNDKKVLDNFTKKTLGIFQFEGVIAKYVVENLRPQNINDISLANALARPGPMQSGLTNKILRGFKDDKLFRIKGYKDITKETRFALVYQEQIMQICRLVGLSWDDTEKIRKLISKSKFNELQKYRNKFSDQYLWNTIIQFGKYAFNKSHSLAYSYLSYLTAYLKTYYPLEFYANNLKVNPRDIRFVAEALHSGIPFGSIRENRTANWKIVNNKICPGFNFIQGIRDQTAIKLEKDLKKQEEILKKFSDKFIIDEYCKPEEREIFSKISDKQLHDIIYVSDPKVETIPVFFKKKYLNKNRGEILVEDYTKAEAHLKVRKESYKMYFKEINNAKRKDIMAIQVLMKPWSNYGELFKVYNLTQRDGYKVKE